MTVLREADRTRIYTELAAATSPETTEILMREVFDARWEDIATKSDIALLDNRFTGVDGRFTGLEDRFTGLEDRFTGLEERFTGLEDRFTGLEGRVEQLETKVTVLEGRVELLDAKVTALDTKVTALDTKVERLDVRITDLQSEMHKAFNAQTWRMISAMIALAGVIVAGMHFA